MLLPLTWPILIYNAACRSCPQWIARRNRWLFGRAPMPPGTRRVRWVFLRALGVIYLVAFTSLGLQVIGLYGQRGIAPNRPSVEACRDCCRPRALSPHSIALLAGLIGRGARSGIQSRTACLRRASLQLCAARRTRGALGGVPILRRCRFRIPFVPVGRSAARNDASRLGDRARRTFAEARARRPVVVGRHCDALARFPPAIRIRAGQAAFGRPYLEGSHGSGVPLRDAAASHATRLACAPGASKRQALCNARDALLRIRRAILDVHASTAAARRLLGPFRPARGHCADGQLRVLQPPHGCAESLVARRYCVRPSVPAGGARADTGNLAAWVASSPTVLRWRSWCSPALRISRAIIGEPCHARSRAP